MTIRWRPAMMLVALVATASVAVVPQAPRVEASVDCDQSMLLRFQSLVNSFRIANGRAALPLSGELNRKAQAWAEHLAVVGYASIQSDPSASILLSHSDLTVGVSAGWGYLGENVGYHSVSLEGVEAALEVSPDHRANLLDTRYTEIGLGVAVDPAGGVWVTQEFARRAVPTPLVVPATGATALRTVAPQAVASVSLLTNTVRRVKVVGVGGIPSTAREVVLAVWAAQTGRVTSTAPSLRLIARGEGVFGPAHLTLAGRRGATTAIVAVAADGTIGMVSSAPADVRVVSLGWFAASGGPASAGRYTPIASAVALNTTSAGNPLTHGAQLTPSREWLVQVTGVGAVPATGVSAVMVQVTAPAGFVPLAVQVGAPGMPAFRMTSVSASVLTTGTALTIAPVDALGRIALRVSAGAHVRVDVKGWFTDATAAPSWAGLFVPSSTTRALDTRTSTPVAGATAFGVADTGSLPACSSAVQGVVTVIPTAGGVTQVGPTVGFSAGAYNTTVGSPAGSVQRVGVVVGTGGTNSLTVRRASTAQAVVDISGWFV